MLYSIACLLRALPWVFLAAGAAYFAHGICRALWLLSPGGCLSGLAILGLAVLGTWYAEGTERRGFPDTAGDPVSTPQTRRYLAQWERGEVQ